MTHNTYLLTHSVTSTITRPCLCIIFFAIGAVAQISETRAIGAVCVSHSVEEAVEHCRDRGLCVITRNYGASFQRSRMAGSEAHTMRT